MKELNIPDDKYQRILRASMEKFAKTGYKKTTMDEIVAAAGISKGLIFHYFGSKRGLYIHLYEFAYGLVYQRIVPSFDESCTDLFERIRQAEMTKIEVMREYPYVLDFLMAARQEKNAELQSELESVSRAKYPVWSVSFMKAIDSTKLREGVELEQVVKIIQWCTNGLLAEHKDSFVLEDVFAEMDVYLATMKRAFYKEECQ